ncbi:hypothetical protein Cantr_04871, partial [Candida viswanathii]
PGSLSEDFSVFKQFNDSISATPYQFDFIVENERGLKMFGIPLYSHRSLLPIIDPSNYQNINGQTLDQSLSKIGELPATRTPTGSGHGATEASTILATPYASGSGYGSERSNDPALALAVIRIKRRTGHTIQQIVDSLVDDVQPEIVSRLQLYNVDYYSYTFTRNAYYDLPSIFDIIKYFLATGTSKHHNHVVFTFLSKIRCRYFTAPSNPSP